MPCCTRHWWDEDVAAFEAQLNVLKCTVGASDGGISDVSFNVLAFLARKKMEVKAIGEHALICAEWDKNRIASRSSKSSDVRVKRFEDIKARFLQPGYSENDVEFVDQLHRHRELRVGKPMSDRVRQRVEPLHRPGVNEIRDPRVLPTGSRHDDFALRGESDGRLIHDHFKAASSQYQVARIDTPSYGRYQLASVGPDYDHSQFSMRANSKDHVTQGSAPEASSSQYSTLADALSLSRSESVTPGPTRPQDQPDARPNEPTLSNPKQCPICRVIFGRKRERDRHVESYIPHSIYCPAQGCPWTGRRQWDFKEHWKKNHSNSGQVPIKTNEIYNPKKFVKSIVDGAPLVEVVESACSMVQERLEKLGKVDVGVNAWGRKRNVDN
ncbi:hypothetical protein F5888DRAFT_629339 [Russula emetica]|nr:hypothetical protein F5888DRAFT_629339 [Russula emetica]